MRASGILMHISSLPSPYGIGTLGAAAYEFVDFLKKSGQRYWQVLPICPTAYGDSPYQSPSSMAGNPYFIDLDLLIKKGLLTKEECASAYFGDDARFVDYKALFDNRNLLLYKAFSRFEANEDFLLFCKENVCWLDDYALFTAIKESKNGAPLNEWEDDLKLRNFDALDFQRQKLCEKIRFYKTLQFWFWEQWSALKTYANKQDVKLIGDMPIYVSSDSADFWANPELFEVDKSNNPALVAGVPPDAFSKTGQLWGNPVYNWENHKKQNYLWWINRFARANALFDVIRVDHFRGFEQFYAVKPGEKTAKNGKWYMGPKTDLFDAATKKLGKLPVIAEDLGHITPSLKEFLEKTEFPGMNVLQFGFSPDADSDYLPYKHKKNSVVYVGTHDNDTALGWIKNGNREEVEYCKKFLRLNEQEGYNWGLIKAALASNSDLCILTMQDILSLDSSARMNTPSTSLGNWRWRMLPGCTNDWLGGILADVTKTYRR